MIKYWQIRKKSLGTEKEKTDMNKTMKILAVVSGVAILAAVIILLLKKK